MVATQRPLTYDDLLKMPDDGNRYEVIGGELIVTPAPRRDHQEVSSNLDWILQRFLRSTGLGRSYTQPVDVVLAQHDIMQPDLIVIRRSRLGIYRPEGVLSEPPDIAIEIISPSSRSVDRVRKMAHYARGGIPEYWIADPEWRTLEIYVLTGADYAPVEPDGEGRLSSRAMPGLQVDPNEVFSGLD